MRFKLNSPRIHLFACIAFTWFVTACVSDVMPTSPVPYEFVKDQKMVRTGMASGRVTDGIGRVLFDSTFNAKEYATREASRRSRTMSHEDSVSVHVLGAMLIGRAHNPSATGTVTVRFGGRDVKLSVSRRNARGDAQDYALSVGNGDTTIVVRAPTATSTDRVVEVKAGSKMLLSSSNRLDMIPISAAQYPPEIIDEAWCRETFELAMAEIVAGVIAILDGIGELSMLEAVSGVVLVGSASGELTMWVEDCWQYVTQWLTDFWMSACQDPIFSWLPVCEE